MMRKQESEIRLHKPKNKVFMIVLLLIFLFILGSTLFYDIFYGFFTSRYQTSKTVQEQTKSDFALKYYGYDLTANARQNLSEEFDSYNIKYTDYNFYAPRGVLLDRNGKVLYSSETLPVRWQTFYEESKNRVCRYLYGDLNGVDGIAPLMRAVPNKNPDTRADALPDLPEGYDIQLFLNPELEMQIYDLLKLNQIKGGCIIQDVPTGQIEVMTATSITSTESEKSGLTQLEACLNSDFLYDSIQTLTPEEQEQAKNFFDYQVRTAEVRNPLTEPDKPEEKITKYCFLTDFDLILERPDNMKETDISEISPLHLNSITQRLFADESRVPVLIQNVLDKQGNPVQILPEYPVSKLDMPALQKKLKACYESYHSENDKNYQISVMRYESGNYADFRYLTGIIAKKDGSVQKAFTLYSKSEKILHFIDSLVYFIDEINQPEGGVPLETESAAEGE